MKHSASLFSFLVVCIAAHGRTLTPAAAADFSYVIGDLGLLDNRELHYMMPDAQEYTILDMFNKVTLEPADYPHRTWAYAHEACETSESVEYHTLFQKVPPGYKWWDTADHSFSYTAANGTQLTKKGKKYVFYSPPHTYLPRTVRICFKVRDAQTNNTATLIFTNGSTSVQSSLLVAFTLASMPAVLRVFTS